MDRIEKDVHQFWMSTCGVDTYRRSTQHARHDTPWNAFSGDNILVCTLWQDQIVKKFDAASGKDRRFVRIGGKRKAWRGPAIRHGKEADENLQQAFEHRLRVVGYEAMPDSNAAARGERKVAYFFLDRAHELHRLFDFSSGDTIRRLGLEEAFGDVRRGGPSEELDPGYIFELVEPKGAFPGSPQVSDIAHFDLTVGAASDPEAESTVSGDAHAVLAGSASEALDDPLADHENEEDSAPFAEAGEGPSVTEGYALKAIPLLIEHVLKQRDDVLVPLTYTQLAEQLDRRNKHGKHWARGLGHVLGRVTELIDGLRADWAEPVPYLTTIVVASQGPSKGLPGIGIRGKWVGYDKLNRADKEAQVAAEHQRILDFGSRWNDILSMLGLPVIGVSASAFPLKDQPKGGFGGGESEEHYALKTFVQANPQLVGADASWFSANEYALRSGDELDVFFKSDGFWIGVEVKSRISDALERDYERGLYQTVKYKAVLNAQAQIDHPNSTPVVKVVLVLENELPVKFRKIAEALGVEVTENVKPVPAANEPSLTAELAD